MTGTLVKNMFVAMLLRPRIAAADVIALNFAPQVLWMALTLISITLSAIVSGLFHFVALPSDEAGDVIRSMLFYSSPIAFALVNWGNAVLSIFVLFWTGRMFGGSGRIQDVLAVIVLFQATVVILLFGLAVLSALLPLITALAFVAFAVWAIWAMITVIDVAHRLENMFKALAVFLVSTVVVPFGLSVILGIIAAPFIGAP